MKLNKKYFLAIFTMFGIQLGFGVNTAIAVPCETEMNATLEYSKEQHRKNNIRFSGAPVDYNFATQFAFTSPNDFWPNLKEHLSRKLEPNLSVAETVAHFRQLNKMARERAINYSSETLNLEICYTQAMVDANANIDAIINGKSTNTSSSNKSPRPATSKQSKSSQKATNNQSNQSNQSNSSDLSKMSQEQLINLADDAKKRGDYAQAYAAELQLTKDPDPEISRQALRSVGFRLREGQGVDKNLTEAQRLLQQAASMGDVPAHSMLCESYLNGIGVSENHSKAFEYCVFAAERGHKTAQANLGWLYESGSGIQHSSKLSDEWTCKAAAQGEPTAVNNVKKAQIRCN